MLEGIAAELADRLFDNAGGKDPVFISGRDFCDALTYGLAGGFVLNTPKEDWYIHTMDFMAIQFFAISKYRISDSDNFFRFEAR